MRALVIVTVAACAHTVARPPALPNAPAHDLASARPGAPSDRGAAKDPRVVDLDIVRVPARDGAEPVSTAELFDQAVAAAKAGQTERALALYRQIVNDFPESKLAPVALYNMAAIYDRRGDVDETIAILRELVAKYPQARESIDGHLYVAAVQAEHDRYADTVATLDALLARDVLTYEDRIEAFARRGYALLELARYDDADAALDAALDAWRKAARVDNPYYIAMAHYYKGETAHRRFAAVPVHLPDDALFAALDRKRALAQAAYDAWRAALDFHQVYWATAAGYQMSQIFYELWEATVRAPYPSELAAAARTKYLDEVHTKVRDQLEKAIEGHRMNVELAKAYGVETSWSRASGERALAVMDVLAKDSQGQYVTP